MQCIALVGDIGDMASYATRKHCTQGEVREENDCWIIFLLLSQFFFIMPFCQCTILFLMPRPESIGKQTCVVQLLLDSWNLAFVSPIVD